MFFKAIHDLDRSKVDAYLAEGGDVNIRNESGQTSLMIAAMSGSEELTRLLIGKGAEVNVADHSGTTPLYLACGWGNLEVVRVLISEGADVNHTNRDLDRPIHSAATKGIAEMVALLLSNGADPEARNSWDQTALMLAAFGGHFKVVQLLLNSSARSTINAMAKHGLTALMYAGIRGHPLTARELIRNGAFIDHNNRFGWNALMYAARENHPRTIKMLLAHGSSRQGYSGATLLGASERGEIARVRYLLNKGANPNVRGPEEETPMILATMRYPHNFAHIWDENTKRMIRYSMATPDAEQKARNYFAVLESLLAAGAHVNGRGAFGSFPMMYANVLEVAELLIRSGADFNAKNDGGITALMIAAGDDSGYVTQRLLLAGADPNARSKDGSVALHWAVRRGGYHSVELLLAAGADVDVFDALGNTPCMLAEQSHHTRIVELLRKIENQHAEADTFEKKD